MWDADEVQYNHINIGSCKLLGVEAMIEEQGLRFGFCTSQVSNMWIDN